MSQRNKPQLVYLNDVIFFFIKLSHLKVDRKYLASQSECRSNVFPKKKIIK